LIIWRASKPVLVNYPGWMAEMVTAEGAGVAVPPQDPVAFADALMRMADSRAATAEMGLRGRNLAQRDLFMDNSRTTLCFGDGKRRRHAIE